MSLGSFGIVAPAAQSLFLGALDAAWLPRVGLGAMASTWTLWRAHRPA